MRARIVLIVSLLVIAACARNPRPESPEQRAQQEARYLQGGEQAEAGPRTVIVSEDDDADDEEARPASPPPSEAENRRRLREQARAQVREVRRAAAVEPLLTPAVPVGGGIGLLR